MDTIKDAVWAAAKSADEFITEKFGHEIGPWISMAIVALAIMWLQMIVVRFRFWMEKIPFPYTCTPFDPLLLFTLPAAIMRLCFGLDAYAFFQKRKAPIGGYIDNQGNAGIWSNNSMKYQPLRDDDDEKEEADPEGNAHLTNGQRMIKSIFTSSKSGRALVIVQRIDEKIGGICVVPHKKKIEYFYEAMPHCCRPYALPKQTINNGEASTSQPANFEIVNRENQNGDDECRHFPDGDATYRMVLAAVAMWRPMWSGGKRSNGAADVVDILVDDAGFLKTLDSHLNIAEAGQDYYEHPEDEGRYCPCRERLSKALGPPLVFHHSKKFACITKEARIWHDLVRFVDVLMQHHDTDVSRVLKAWLDTPFVSGWTKNRQRMKLHQFHTLQHPHMHPQNSPPQHQRKKAKIARNSGKGRQRRTAGTF